MRSICITASLLILGCTAHEPVAVESPRPEASLSEQDVRDIAEEVAEEVIARAGEREVSRAAQEQKPSTNAIDEQALLQHEAAAAAEEQALAEAVERSEEAYWLLVPSERKRVDAIRERLAKVGLTRLEHEDIQWAWHGDGHDCLQAELLAAARKSQDQLEADTAALGLTDGGLIEFFCLEPLEQLRRLHLAQRFIAGDAIEEGVIIEFRRDPFMRKLVTQYMKGQTKRSQ
jgi:hypothetical protein